MNLPEYAQRCHLEAYLFGPHTYIYRIYIETKITIENLFKLLLLLDAK